MSEQESYTVVQAAELTGRRTGWFYSALGDGRVKGHREKGKAAWRIPVSEVERLQELAASGGIDVEDEAEVEEVPADVDKILAEIGGESSQVSLFRKSRKGNHAYLKTFLTDEFSLGTLSELYGGGDFMIRFLRPDGTILKTKNFEVEGPPKAPPTGVAAAVAPGSSAAPFAQDSMGMMITMFRETLLEIKEAIREKSGGDPMVMAVKMAELIQAGTANAIEGLKLRGGGDGGLDALGAIELFERAMSLGQSLAGEGGGQSDLISRLGGEVIDVLREKRKEEKEVSAGARSLPSAQGSEQPPPADVSKPAWLPLMKPWVPQLLGWARAGKSVELYADVVADNLPAQAADFLWKQIPDPTFIESFYREFPDCVGYRWWFDQMFAALHRVLGPEPAPEELDEAEGEVVSSADEAVGRGPRDVSDLVDDAPAGEPGGSEPLDDPGG